ncbi:flotillin-like FloA family protein, partial [bacterium]|nr:flotillin-like FloA family protein [bacterium]
MLGLGVVVFVAVVVVFWLFFWLFPVKLWIAAKTTKAPVGMVDMIFMRLRRVNPGAIVNPLIMAVQARVNVSRSQLEIHYLAGGDVWMVVKAMISAAKAKIDLTADQACAIDLAGRNVFEAVKMSVQPRVIDCPNPDQGKQTIDAVAKDGIQLRAKARVTVRANLERLVGGATEETIIARVGEG